MLPLEVPRCSTHPAHPIRSGAMPHVPSRERVRKGDRSQPVPILPGPGAPPGVEAQGSQARPNDDLWTQHSIQGPLHSSRICVRRERDHLALGVDPRVGPSSHGDAWNRSENPPERILQHSLDGPRPGLASEATKVGPVVGQHEFQNGYACRYSAPASSTSSICAIGAPSPLRGPSFRIRV